MIRLLLSPVWCQITLDIIVTKQSESQVNSYIPQVVMEATTTSVGPYTASILVFVSILRRWIRDT